MADDGAAALARPTIPVRYLAEIAGRSRVRKRALDRALGAAGLPRDALRYPRLRVSVAQVERFHGVLRREMQDECFGYLARPVPPGAYATLVRLLAGALDVAACFDATSRFYRLFDRHGYWRLSVGRSATTLELLPRDGDQARSAFFVHSMLLAPWRTAAWLAANPLALGDLRLPRTLAPLAREARYLFGRDPVFTGGAASLAFPSELARLPIVRTLGEVDAFVRGSLRRLLAAPPGASVIDGLRALLCASEPPAAAWLADAARRLGLSRASLARALARHGTSFQQVKDDVRRDRAIELLSSTSLTIARIAERVGYADPSAFQRAFRSWTGTSPGSLRG